MSPLRYVDEKDSGYVQRFSMPPYAYLAGP